jgi:hypothetical protein
VLAQGSIVDVRTSRVGRATGADGSDDPHRSPTQLVRKAAGETDRITRAAVQQTCKVRRPQPSGEPSSSPRRRELDDPDPVSTAARPSTWS